jgi:hypothetical protein
MLFLQQSGSKSDVLEKSQKQHVFGTKKNIFFLKGHHQKLFETLFWAPACFSDAGTTFGIYG